MIDRTTVDLAALVARAVRGGDAAMQRLVEHVHPIVHRWALVWTGDPTEADDLTQDVLIRMVRNLDSYNGDARFETWLYTMTRNLARDRGRRAGRQRRLVADPRALDALVPDAAPDPSGLVERAELRELLRTFFEELPDRQRTAFDLVELQGMGAAEAAELMGVQPVSVRANLFKARRRLRARILETRPELAGGRR